LSLTTAVPGLQLMVSPFSTVLPIIGFNFFYKQLRPVGSWAFYLASVLFIFGQGVLPTYYSWEGAYALFAFLIAFGLLVRAFNRPLTRVVAALPAVFFSMLPLIYSGMFLETIAVFLVAIGIAGFTAGFSQEMRHRFRNRAYLFLILALVLVLSLTYDVLFPYVLDFQANNLLSFSYITTLLQGNPLQASGIGVEYSPLSRAFVETPVLLLAIVALVLILVDLRHVRRSEVSSLPSRWIAYSFVVAAPVMFILDIQARGVLSPAEGGILLTIAVPALLSLRLRDSGGTNGIVRKFLVGVVIAVVVLSLVGTFIIAGDTANQLYIAKQPDYAGVTFLSRTLGPYFASSWLGTMLEVSQPNTPLANFVVYPGSFSSAQSAAFLYNGTNGLTEGLERLGVHTAVFREVDFTVGFFTANIALKPLPQYSSNPNLDVVYEDGDLIVYWF
ncbi:MAG: hypothetical protein JRN67_08755, partial [Nitrososphaerota archaeon]|nr:hypothetical protein [Nitrososphaerota archaeon]